VGTPFPVPQSVLFAGKAITGENGSIFQQMPPPLPSLKVDVGTVFGGGEKLMSSPVGELADGARAMALGRLLAGNESIMFLIM